MKSSMSYYRTRPFQRGPYLKEFLGISQSFGMREIRTVFDPLGIIRVGGSIEAVNDFMINYCPYTLCLIYGK